MNKDITHIFSQNLNRLMQSRNETLTDLSNSIDVAFSTVSDWKHGNKMPRSGSLQKLADHYRVNISQLTSEQSVNEYSMSSTYNYFDTGISAGILAEVDPFTSNEVEQINLSDVILGKYAGDKDILVTHVNGESMNRSIPNHSLIAVKKFDSIHDLQNGDIVIFQDGVEMSMKRFYNRPERQTVSFSPDSDDKTFGPISYKYDELNDLSIIGKVVVYAVEADNL